MQRLNSLPLKVLSALRSVESRIKHPSAADYTEGMIGPKRAWLRRRRDALFTPGQMLSD